MGPLLETVVFADGELDMSLTTRYKPPPSDRPINPAQVLTKRSPSFKKAPSPPACAAARL